MFTSRRKIQNKNLFKLYRSSQKYFEEISADDTFLVYYKGRTGDAFEYYLTYKISEFDVGFWLILRVFQQEQQNYHFFLLNKTPVHPSRELRMQLSEQARTEEPVIDGLFARDISGAATLSYHQVKIQFGQRYLVLTNNGKPVLSFKRELCKFV